MVLKQFHASHIRSEEDARTSWCPCVNPDAKPIRLDSPKPRAPSALRSLVIQHNKSRNWKHWNKHERTETRNREKCRPMPGATCHPKQGNLRPRHTHQLRPQGYRAKSSTKANQGTRVPSAQNRPGTPSLAIPKSPNSTITTQKTSVPTCLRGSTKRILLLFVISLVILPTTT